MTLTLRVTCDQNKASNELSIMVDQNGCSIGRGNDNDIVLPDSQRIVSHRHANIYFIDNNYFLTDTSTNGTYINHSLDPVGNGNNVKLHDGDILSIGEYECRVSMVVNDNIAADAIINPTPELDLEQPPMAQPWETPLSPPYEIPESPPLRANHEPEQIPNDRYTPGVIHSAISEGGERAAENGAVEEQFFRPPEAIPEDWDKLLDNNEEQPSPLRPEPAQTPEKTPEKARALPTAQSNQADILKPVTVAAQETPEVNQQAVTAFLNGANLASVELTPEQITQVMHTAGQLLHAMTDGYKQILETRASLKNEFRLGMTTIRPVENNPLKFSIDTEDALKKLLFPLEKGYLAPLAAVHEASDDIQAHQMATLSGLRVALNTLVQHFDPQRLEQEFQDVSVVDGLLPFVRKAKYWDLFKGRYLIAAADAENDFLHFLGDEFSSAYEQQIEKLKSARGYK